MTDIFEGLQLNPRQKAFVEHYIETGNAIESCRRAGYSPASVAPQSLKIQRNSQVQIALSRHRAKMAERHEITMDSMTEMYMQTYEGAMAAKQYSAATNALTSLAKMHGLLVEKVHNMNEDLNQTHLEVIRELAERGDNVVPLER